jgi:hypothetical protein
MLNIRINFTIDVKKVLRGVAAIMLVCTQMYTPAHATHATVHRAAAIVREVPVTMSLDHVTVHITRTEAKKALKSSYVKYFDSQAIAFLTEYSAGKSLEEWKCLDSIWSNESHFNPKALNKSSKAYGIAQFMPSTWANYKVKKTESAALQIKYGLRYIKSRYGDACNAWRFWKKHYWY